MPAYGASPSQPEVVRNGRSRSACVRFSILAWGEGYFDVARSFFVYGEHSNDARHFEQAVHFAREGLRAPPTKTRIFIDHTPRMYDVHDVLNRSLGRLGRYEEAIAACDAGLEGLDVVPGTHAGNLAFNREFYRKQIGSATEPATKEKDEKKMRIVFACGDCWEVWNPRTIAEKGMGGSETAVAEMAKRLAALECHGGGLHELRRRSGVRRCFVPRDGLVERYPCASRSPRRLAQRLAHRAGSEG